MSSINDAQPDETRVFQDSYDLSSTVELDGRTVTKYVLKRGLDGGGINHAATTITTFLEQNPIFCAIFPTAPLEDLRRRIQEKRYLVINGHAVCLVRGPEEKNKPEYKDRYFSETLLEHPVKCTQGHLLELEAVRFWVEKYGDLCPERFEEDHRIGPLLVNRNLERDIAGYREAQQETENSIRAAGAGGKKIDRLEMATAASKIVIKAGGKKICLQACKLVMNEGSKAMVKNMIKIKIIPGLSVVMGVILAGYRFYQGEFYRGCGELASGAAACWPGPGTGLSIAIDLVLAAEDVRQATKKPTTVADIRVEITLAQAYEALGINIRETPNPTREQVEHSWREQMPTVHPDVFQRAGESEFLDEATATAAALTAIKVSIYEQRGWT